MNDALKSQINAAFPTGKDWEPDKNQFDASNYKSRIESIIRVCTGNFPVHITSSCCFHYQEFAITHKSCPEFGEWISMSNPEKINWIETNNVPYVVLWVKVSRVADYYITFFNHWKPRENTGYLDADCRQKPSDAWEKISSAIFEVFQKNGFILADSKLLNESVPSVLTWGGDQIPENDPRWDDDDFEPDPIPAVVYDCLFGDQ